MRVAKHHLTLGSLLAMACSTPPTTPVTSYSYAAATAPPMQIAAATAPSRPVEPAPSETPAFSEAVSSVSGQQPLLPEGKPTSRPLQVIDSTPACSVADWSAQKLKPLLTSGRGAKRSVAGQSGAEGELFGSACSDSPGPASRSSLEPAVVDGVRIRVLHDTPAGKSGRGWLGTQCELEFSFADGGGVPVVLHSDRVPPFNSVRALIRQGSALWVNLGFNGYAREFPRGGNRIVALDLCEGRVVWQSKDAVSNGGLLLLDGYLTTAYGFTAERRYVFVLDSHTGSVVQRLPVVENRCPSKAWAPNWQPGERCDAPGQAVGAATNPRIEDGVFMVDTNTGSSAFSFVE